MHSVPSSQTAPAAGKWPSVYPRPDGQREQSFYAQKKRRRRRRRGGHHHRAAPESHCASPTSTPVHVQVAPHGLVPRGGGSRAFRAWLTDPGADMPWIHRGVPSTRLWATAVRWAIFAIIVAMALAAIGAAGWVAAAVIMALAAAIAALAEALFKLAIGVFILFVVICIIGSLVASR